MMRAMPNRHDLSATYHVILIRYQERDHLGHYRGPTFMVDINMVT